LAQPSQHTNGFIRKFLSEDILHGDLLRPTTFSVSNPGVADMENQRKEKRFLKRKARVTNLVLGENIQLNEITTMQQETLVGRFVSKRLSANTLRH